jgi:hypothetical protein
VDVDARLLAHRRGPAVSTDDQARPHSRLGAVKVRDRWPGTRPDAHFPDSAHEFRAQAHSLAGKGLARLGMGGAQGAAHARQDG